MKHILFPMMVITLGVITLSASSISLQQDTILNQNQKFSKSASIGINLANFIPTKLAKQGQMRSVLLNPGFEVLLNLNSNSDNVFSSGILYQMGKIQRSYPLERVIFEEISVPILFTTPISKSKAGNFSLSSGLYIGKYLNANIESKGGKLNPHNDWIRISKEFINGYSDINQIVDLFIALNFKELDLNGNYFQLRLFSKLRLKKHWVNEDVSKFLWGINISYTIKH